MAVRVGFYTFSFGSCESGSIFSVSVLEGRGQIGSNFFPVFQIRVRLTNFLSAYRDELGLCLVLAGRVYSIFQNKDQNTLSDVKDYTKSDSK